MKTTPKRASIYFYADLHRALQVKVSETGKSVSELVNQAVRLFLAEDTEDLGAFEERRHEPNLPLEDVLKENKVRKG